ncbi:MAG: hypothetical protein HY688_00955 [Chloroflexi bacterium]|nr:hypothetical protein [Chloroflexota bacterium]
MTGAREGVPGALEYNSPRIKDNAWPFIARDVRWAARRYSESRRNVGQGRAKVVPDIVNLPQGLLRGLDLGTVLALRPHPAWGYGLMIAGLALCLVGYWLYRLMVALAAAVVVGALAYLVMPGFNIQGIALWSGVVGTMMVLFVVGWFLYAVAVFLVGAFAGLMLGAAFWLLTADRFTSLADLRQVTIVSEDLLYLAAATVLPAMALGILAVRWERAVVTVVAVILGSLALALGLRYAPLPRVAEPWGAAAAGVALVAGLFVNFRPRGQTPAARLPRRRVASGRP